MRASRTGTNSQSYAVAWWGLWIVPTLIFSAGAGLWAVKDLLELPSFPQCRSISQVDSTASARLYCAEQFANQQKVPDLRRAILLANSIAEQDPLWVESRRAIERWSRSILETGEAEFQAGQLETALKTAQSIPMSVHTYAIAEERMERWRSVWERAKAIYDQAEDEIDQRQWSAAMNTARGLLTIGNRHWSTTKYQTLLRSLQASKESQSFQAAAQARSSQRQSSARNSESFEDYFARRDRERSAEDAAYLDEAYQLAGAGSLSGLRSAIDEASRILYGSSQYAEAQQAIEGWRNQIEIIEDAPYLDRARALANQGDLTSLEAAIDEVRNIGWGRALYDEAYAEMQQWRETAHQLRVQAQAEQLETLTAPTTETNSSQPNLLQPTSLQPHPVPVVQTIETVGTTETSQPGNLLN
ncbi:hypothetical protein [Thermocoleostomius sinensis]|uniref:Chromosome segregation ATPase n=1 Tax=Thermocoleostomius sinensis A174 TaxID=2016057 RepID=A0A9E9CBL1_9CYAN|nr:hypothetical protein [Thermocoleostomius sinensis]WAL60740.1 hypothetical protein OXH18_01710 [Thermocoleostomius sinensis A174]